MPAKTKRQRRLFGMALSVLDGDQTINDLPAAVRDDVKRINKEVSRKEIEKFAKTPEKGLPETTDLRVKLLILREQTLNATESQFNLD